MKLTLILALLTTACSSGGGISTPTPSPTPTAQTSTCTQIQVGSVGGNPVILDYCPGATTSLIIENVTYPGVGICGDSPGVTRLPNINELVFCIGGNTNYATYPFPVGVSNDSMFQYTGQPMKVNDPGYSCDVTWSGCTATATALN